MKTKDQIEFFLTKKLYCCFCNDFKKDLSKIYKEKGLTAAQNFIDEYKGMICGALESFLYFDN